MVKKVIVGISGGVDSAVCAFLLKQQGFEVIGVNLALSDIANTLDAKKVADYLEIEFYEIDRRDIFAQNTEKYFLSEYLKGKTPIPCAVCNRKVKFAELIKAADSLGADFVATGHYANIVNENGKAYLKASASKKDQSYFLSRLTNEQLSRIIFPLNDATKTKIREIAEQNNIPVAQKKDSQELCFVPDDDYAKYIIEKTGTKPKKGDFIDTNGNKVGEHNGIIYYTIGQRKGLGVAFGKPMFVININAENNTITLGEMGSQFSQSLVANDINWLKGGYEGKPFNGLVKIRCQAQKANARITPIENYKLKVEFDEPQKAITSGQLAVVYDENDFVICSGFID